MDRIGIDLFNAMDARERRNKTLKIKYTINLEIDNEQFVVSGNYGLAATGNEIYTQICADIKSRLDVRFAEPRFKRLEDVIVQKAYKPSKQEPTDE